MISRETCPNCKGNRWVMIKDPAGKELPRKCPHCAGQGFKVRVRH